MNRIFLMLTFTVLASTVIAQDKQKNADTTLLQPVELIAIRASEKTPIAKTNLSRKEIQDNNIGMDLPFIINQTPSVQVHSDAGNGIGYTGIRIRGSDASRINVTINGIPYNDAESQGTFFVDLPDIASSAGSIQIQRGVGTSTNGAGSFGGSINISTNDIDTKKSFTFNNSFGSFHSFKNTFQYNSGLQKKKFIFNARASQIRSDGFIDRASSRLGSLYGSAAYIDSTNKLQLNVFTGKEKTYQAWYGIDQNTLATNRRFNAAGTEKPGEPYDNETDNYTQTHYQLFYTRKINRFWKANVALFLTQGKGYYEQYKAGQSLNKYGLPAYFNGTDSIFETDLVRRLWLDNDFFGTVYSFQYSQLKRQVIVGGSWNRYNGKHFGDINKTITEAGVPKGFRWYDNRANKTDLNQYIKWTESLGQNWQLFTDLQVRAVQYRINGFRNNPGLQVSNDYFFFNPKAGISYSKSNMRYYLYYGFAAKEPNRDDFESGLSQQPKPEKLQNLELGIQQQGKNHQWGINLYHMKYKDQLVLTGKINDVGAYTRSNIPDSYRAGIEMTGAVRFNKWFSINGNLSLSRNKVKNFTEYIDDYDQGGQIEKDYKETDIAFSPGVISAINAVFVPIKNFDITLMGKYVGRQYLDNTSNNSRQLNDYFVQDIRLTYKKENKKSMSWNAFIQANNIFSKKYEANGYTFSYLYGNELVTENYFFPMAPINVMAGFGISF